MQQLPFNRLQIKLCKIFWAPENSIRASAYTISIFYGVQHLLGAFDSQKSPQKPKNMNKTIFVCIMYQASRLYIEECAVQVSRESIKNWARKCSSKIWYWIMWREEMMWKIQWKCTLCALELSQKTVRWMDNQGVELFVWALHRYSPTSIKINNDNNDKGYGLHILLIHLALHLPVACFISGSHS